jgi:F0F1-type ATP synthase assembly protein I
MRSVYPSDSLAKNFTSTRFRLAMTGKPGGEPKGVTSSDFAGVGLQLAICIIGGLYLGQYLDRRFGTAPWLLFVGVFGGFSAGFYSMYRKLMAAQAREDAAKAARREGPDAS